MGLTREGPGSIGHWVRFQLILLSPSLTGTERTTVPKGGAMRDKDKDEDQVPETSQPEEERAGVDRRRFLGSAGAVAVGALAGLSGGGAQLMAASRRSGDPVIEWGPRGDLKGL